VNLSFQFLMRLFDSIERHQHFRQFESSARRIFTHDFARSRDGFSRVSTNHISASQHTLGTKLFRIPIERRLRVAFRSLRVVGVESQLGEQRIRIRCDRGCIQRTTHRSKHCRCVRLLQQQASQFAQTRRVLRVLQLREIDDGRPRICNSIQLDRDSRVHCRRLAVAGSERSPSDRGLPRRRDMLTSERHLAGASS